MEERERIEDWEIRLSVIERVQAIFNEQEDSVGVHLCSITKELVKEAREKEFVSPELAAFIALTMSRFSDIENYAKGILLLLGFYEAEGDKLHQKLIDEGKVSTSESSSEAMRRVFFSQKPSNFPEEE